MPAHSGVARLQQVTIVVTLAAAFAWIVFWWRTHPALALAGALAITCFHTVLFAVELGLLVATRGSDPTPKASPGQLIGAWWRETMQSFVVFAGRQPFAWRREPDRLHGEPGRVGIVFVHGFICNRGFWAPWMREAAARGHACIAPNLEPAFGGIDTYAALIDDAVTRLRAATGRAPVLVCHSMGGLAARAWLRHAGAVDRVRHVVTIGTPHRGAWIARWSHVENGRQMRIGGAWLQELEAALPAKSKFTCWYGNADNIVFPPSTATLPQAENRLVPGAAHVDLAFQPRVINETFALLRDL